MFAISFILTCLTGIADAISGYKLKKDVEILQKNSTSDKLYCVPRWANTAKYYYYFKGVH